MATPTEFHPDSLASANAEASRVLLDAVTDLVAWTGPFLNDEQIADIAGRLSSVGRILDEGARLQVVR